MHKDNHNSPVALAYAQALLELANESKSAPDFGQELRDLRQILDLNPKFQQVLTDPAIGDAEVGKLIHTVFDGRASKLLVNLLGLLNEKGRLSLLAGIAGAYDDLLEAQQGKVEVDVTSAQKLTPQQVESVRQKIGAALKREAVVHEYDDPSILGGLILRVQDQLIDGSVRAQLQAMRQKLLAARPQ
ncbi:MAG: ATP synthase F1 subunit delta [Tepidisphaeraceae bacterium]|jgi:F-type H+-transporting ATPase subunit delta